MMTMPRSISFCWAVVVSLELEVINTQHRRRSYARAASHVRGTYPRTS